MRLCVVIPVHNGERYLQSTLRSALNQARRADEIILVDDASTDRSAAIADSPEWNGGIKYFYNDKSTGFVDAWNRAIARATGDFVTILHQDDLLHPDYLAHIENALQNYPQVRHIYAACIYIDEQGSIIGIPPGPHSVEPMLYSGKQYAKSYLNGMVTNQHIHRAVGVTTKLDLLLNQCSYRKEAGLIADDDFFMRVGAFTDVIGISKPLTSFRLHSYSTTSKLDSLSLSLAEDYLFQTRYYKENNGILDNNDILKLNKQAVKFINLLLFQAILYKRPELSEKAFKIREQLAILLPFLIEESSPRWARLMWSLANRGPTTDRATNLYVTFLYRFVKMRNRFHRK